MTEENKGAAVALPEPMVFGQAWTVCVVGDTQYIAPPAVAKELAALRVRLAQVEENGPVIERGRDQHGNAVMGTMREVMNDYANAAAAEAKFVDEMQAKCADLRAQLAAVEAEVVQLRAQRDEAVAALKWMAQQGARVAWASDGEACNVWLPDERDGTPERPAEGYPQKIYYTWEEAITAASGLSLASLKGQA